MQGIAPDIVKSLLTKLGVKVQYSPGLPWPQVLAKAKAREIDLIALAAKSKDREEYLLFSKPYMSFPLVIMTRRNFRFVGGLDDLHGVNTALIRGVPTSKWLQREGIAVKPYPVDSPLAALEAVSLGKADASIHNLGAATYLIEKHNLNNLQVAAPTSWGDYQVYFAVRKDWPLLVSILNKTMAAMSPAHKSAIRNQWISVRFEHGIQVRDVALWVGMVAAVAAVLLLLFFLHNRSLRKEVLERKAAQKEREQSIEKLQVALINVKKLSGLLPICASCKKIRDDKGYWQQVEQYVDPAFGGGVLSHSICPECAAKLYPEYMSTPLNKNKGGDEA